MKEKMYVKMIVVGLVIALAAMAFSPAVAADRENKNLLEPLDVAVKGEQIVENSSDCICEDKMDNIKFDANGNNNVFQNNCNNVHINISSNGVSSSDSNGVCCPSEDCHNKCPETTSKVAKDCGDRCSDDLCEKCNCEEKCTDGTCETSECCKQESCKEDCETKCSDDLCGTCDKIDEKCFNGLCKTIVEGHPLLKKIIGYLDIFGCIIKCIKNLTGFQMM